MESYRPPRVPVVVKAPPPVPRAAPVNPLARLLPVAMVVAAVGMLALYVNTGAASRSPVFMFFPVMMLVSVLGSVAYGARGTQHTSEINESRRAYLRYLDDLAEVSADAAGAQYTSLLWRHPDPETLWAIAGGPRMWERTPADVDFCVTRVGVGSRPPSTSLVAPEVDAREECDPVTLSALERLVGNRSLVAGVPITLPLNEIPVLSVGGADARGAVRAIVCQLAAHHGPEHVRIAAVVDAAAASHWEWMKWLPHHQHPYATDEAGPARLRYDELVAAQHELRSAGRVVVVADGADATGLASLTEVSVVIVVDGCGSTSDGYRLSTEVDAEVGGGILAQADSLTAGQALTCARRLAPYEPAARAEHVEAKRDWAALIGATRAVDVVPQQFWRSRAPNARLTAPIGTDERGTVVELDIKEATHGGMGPHGLCVGATGSGKSEFLRTLVLGMVATHPPDELNLVLVDFKGGATFLGLERAPHVSAVITNLAGEAHLVVRMREALAGEMNRRQEALRAAGNFADLAAYHAARRRGAHLAPLPALLIVVDEFSELLQQHPDFAELFVTIGRLGRSLGMHLLLASQRLDEGRLRGLDSHLSYRICLKTFSAAESRAVIGCPDAYQLPNNPGEAYLKTSASDELTHFRTVYVSGDAGADARDVGARHVDHAECVPQIFTAAPTHNSVRRSATADAESPTVLDVVLDNLAGHGPPAHRVWLDPLGESPALGDLLAGWQPAALTVPIGVIDRPFEQRRDPLVVDMSGAAGNVAIVGGPRAGKSCALRTLLLALAATHDSTDVQLYCLDFGGGALTSLRGLPHVGAVAGRHDADLVRRIIAEVESILRSRERLFHEHGVDSVTEYRRRRAAGAAMEDPFGDVFLVIDGWAGVRHDFEVLETTLATIAAQGLSLGVHVILTASRWAEIRPALKDQLGTRIELRLGDPAESEMNRKRARELGDCPPGRGINRNGEEVTIAVVEAVASAVDSVRGRGAGPDAPRVRLLPRHVDAMAVAQLPATRSATSVVVGLGERQLSPVAIDFDDQSHLMILGDGECGKTSTLRALCHEIVRSTEPGEVQMLIVDYRRSLLGEVESGHLAGYAMSATTLTRQVTDLLERLENRMPGEAVTQHQLRSRSWWSGPEVYVVVDDYDLVAGANTNPLSPLIDYLPHAKDIGLHLVIARRSGGAARAMFDPLVSRMRDLGSSGFMMSAGPDDGVLLGSVRPRPMPPGRGTLVTRSRPDELIQVAWTDPG